MRAPATAAAANLEENSPKTRCWLRCSMRQKVAASQNAGAAAVAQGDLVAVGQPEELGEAGPEPADDRLHRGLAVAGAEKAAPGRGQTLRAPRAAPWRGRSRSGRRRGQVGRDSNIRQRSAGHCASMAAMARISARVSAVAASATLAIDAKAKALKAAGEDVIGFGAGEPDFPTPSPIVEAAVEACRDPRNHKYSPTGGLPELQSRHRRQDGEGRRPCRHRRPGARDQRRQAGRRAGLRHPPRPG